MALCKGIKEKVVVTDLNGPWIRGDVTYRIIRHLVLNKKLEPTFAYDQASSNMEQYESGKIPYSIAIDQVMSAYDNLTRGKSAKEVCAMIDDYIKTGHIPLHSYCNDFLKRLKDNGRKVIGLTSSPEEITQPLKKYALKMDEIISTPHQVAKDGTFRPLSNPMIKVELKYAAGTKLKEESRDLDWTDSIGIGDTKNDIGIFDHTDIKVALNPDRELYEWVKRVQARGEAGWFIAPDCLALADAILLHGIDKAVANGEKELRDMLVVTYGKLNNTPVATLQLPAEYRHIIDAGRMLCAFGARHGWDDKLIDLMNEKFATPAYVMNTDTENPRYDYPGRKQFTEIFDKIWNSLPQAVMQKIQHH